MSRGLSQWVKRHSNQAKPIIILVIFYISLSFYLIHSKLIKLDKFSLLANVLLFSSLALATSAGLRLIQKNNLNIFEATKQEISQLKVTLLDNKKSLFLSLSLFLIFYALYLTIGILLIPDYEPYKFTFFYADQGDWTSLDWSKYHKGSHPLILLFLAPFSVLWAFHPPIPTIVLAIIINSFFGAFAIFVSSLAFWNLTKKYSDTLLLTLLFGLSMSQLFFSSLLESYALASCSVITTYVLFIICLQQQKLYLGYWIVAGIFSFGVTITNFAQTLICFTTVILIFKEKRKGITLLEYIASIVSICFLLNLLQKEFFGGAYFFIPGMVAREIVWIKTTIFNHPLLVLQEIIKHFFLANFVAPSPFPEKIIPGAKIILSFFDRPLDYSIVGLIGTILWLFFFLTGIYKNISLATRKNKSIKNHRNKILWITFCLTTLFNISLYSVFDTEEMFLFTCNFTFPVLLLAVNKPVLEKAYFKITLILLIFFMSINNLMIMRQIIIL